MHYKIEFKQEDHLIIEADDEMQAQNQFELVHNVEPGVFKHIIDVNPVAVNARGEVFELREIVKVPDSEAATKELDNVQKVLTKTTKLCMIAAIYDNTVLCIQTDSNDKITSEQEVPQSILMKIWR